MSVRPLLNQYRVKNSPTAGATVPQSCSMALYASIHGGTARNVVVREERA